VRQINGWNAISYSEVSDVAARSGDHLLELSRHIPTTTARPIDECLRVAVKI